MRPGRGAGTASWARLDADSCAGAGAARSHGSREVLSPRSAAASGWSARYTGSGVRYAAGPACSFSELFPRPASCCSGVHLDHRYRAGGGGGRGVRDRGDQADRRRGAAAAGQRGGDRAGPGRQISVLAPVGSARSTRWSRRRTGCWPLRPQPVGPDLATEVMASQVTGAIGASPTDATFAGCRRRRCRGPARRRTGAAR